jgi:hypothetical protein
MAVSHQRIGLLLKCLRIGRKRLNLKVSFGASAKSASSPQETFKGMVQQPFQSVNEPIQWH